MTPIHYAEVIPTTRPGLIRLQADVQTTVSPSDPLLVFEALVVLAGGGMIIGSAFTLRGGVLRVRTLSGEIEIPEDATIGFRWGRAVRRVSLSDQTSN
jgi:hypothetical protein